MAHAPLCSAEIKKLARFSDDELELKDIHELDGVEDNLDKALLLLRFHLKTANGEWVIGLNANMRAWQHTCFVALWRLLDLPVINRFSRRAYEFWLHSRSKKA